MSDADARMKGRVLKAAQSMHTLCFNAGSWSEAPEKHLRSWSIAGPLPEVFEHRHDSWVYFVRGDAFVKIGSTTNPQKRLDTLRMMSPVSLRLYALLSARDIRIHAKTVEGALHHMFWHYRHHGEWFRYGKDIHDFLDRVGAKTVRCA